MARHTTASLALKLVATGCGFLYAVAAARLLGPSGYGIVAVALSVVTVAATFSLFGTNGLAVRETAALTTAGSWGQFRGFVRWSSLTVLCASLALGLAVAAAGLVDGAYSDAFALGSIGVPLLAGLYLLRGISQGAGRVVAAQVPMDLIRWVVTLTLIGMLLLRGAGATPRDFLLIVLIALAIALVVAAGMLWRYLKGVTRSEPSPPNTRRWLPDSLPFLGIALFGIIGTEINTLLLGWLASPREAGLYQPIAKLAPIMLLAREAIEMPLAPRIVSLWGSGSRPQLERIVQRSALACVLATTFIVAAVLILSPYIFAAFGPEFGEYRSYLYWIAAAQLIGVAAGPAPVLLSMLGGMKLRVQAQIITLLVQAGMGLALVPTLGAAGAAFALAGAIVTWSVLHWFLAWRETKIDTSAFSVARRLIGSRE